MTEDGIRSLGGDAPARLGEITIHFISGLSGDDLAKVAFPKAACVSDASSKLVEACPRLRGLDLSLIFNGRRLCPCEALAEIPVLSESVISVIANIPDVSGAYNVEGDMEGTSGCWFGRTLVLYLSGCAAMCEWYPEGSEFSMRVRSGKWSQHLVESINGDGSAKQIGVTIHFDFQKDDYYGCGGDRQISSVCCLQVVDAVNGTLAVMEYDTLIEARLARLLTAHLRREKGSSPCDLHERELSNIGKLMGRTLWSSESD